MMISTINDAEVVMMEAALIPPDQTALDQQIDAAVYPLYGLSARQAGVTV